MDRDLWKLAKILLVAFAALAIGGYLIRSLPPDLATIVVASAAFGVGLFILALIVVSALINLRRGK